MASLANQTISSTYDGLIKTSTDQPVPISGVQLLEDGVGNSLALSVGRANQGVTITGTLTATSISGVLADGVTATTQTAGDNSTKVATTAYVDSIVTAQDLDFAGDSGTGAVDLDSQTFTIAGTANEIETSASGQTITIGLPSSVTVGTLNATTLGGTLSTAAQTNITSVGTLSGLTVAGATSVNNANLNLSNAYFLTGRNNANTLSIGLIGRDVNDRVIIDADGYGTRIGSGGLLTITSSNVGIGTSSPSASHILTLNSDTDYKGLTLTGIGAKFIELISSSSNQQAIIGYASATKSWTSGLQTDGSFIWYDNTASTERMRISSAGNVGIGTSSPSYPLDVFGGGGIRLRDDANLRFVRIIPANSTATNAPAQIDSNSSLGFAINVAGSEKVRFPSTGGITFNGDTAAANALDDYEEGTWTPTITFTNASVGTTYTVATGKYTKIGNQVSVNGYIILSNKGTSTGIARVGGLPFTIFNNDANYSGASIGYISAISYANNIMGHAEKGTTSIVLNESTEAGVNTTILDSNFANNSAIIISMTYFVS